MKLTRRASIAALMFMAASMTASVGGIAAAADKTSPVLVELFTSEGCSSCPPADELVIKLQTPVKAREPVIILGEHVDYWDHLGWKDLYSAPLYTERQQAYGARLGHTIFTPEIIVDGTVSATGNDSRAVGAAINQCRRSSAKAQLSIKTQPRGADSSQNKVEVTWDCPRELEGKRAILYVAVTEDNLKSRVGRGENSGRLLTHTGVVRSMQKVGQTQVLSAGKQTTMPASIVIDKHWRKNSLRVVAFLQDPNRLAVYGASAISLE